MKGFGAMKISVCMIVKDEEEVIERCLKTVLCFADEIIVVDTGSVDATREKVSKYTDKIYDFIWINDFSAARNYAFSKASGDYLFWLDADDVVPEEDGRKISELKRVSEPADTYMMKYYASADKNGNPQFEYYRERLMKKCDKAFFCGFIHECVAPFGKIVYSDVKVIHKKEKLTNGSRNLDIFEYHIKKGKVLNARERYYYGKEFFYAGDYARCAEELKKFLDMKYIYGADEWDALLTCFLCYEKTGKRGGIEFLFEALKKFGPDSKTFCVLGDYYRKNLSLKNAEVYYKTALACGAGHNGFFNESKYFFLEPALRLVALYFEGGEYEKAKKFHLMCKKYYPLNESVIFNDKFFKV